MASSVGQIGLDLVVNQNQFQTQMQGILGVAKKAGTAMAAAFGVKKLVSFGQQCLELGSDLAEVQNVVDVTFPSMTAQVDKFAQSAAQSFGLSETMAKQYTGTFGAMAKAFGFSEQQAYDMGASLTQLTGDVASFYNLSQDEAYTKLKSVFTGETESLKDLGVVMTQTALDSYAMANGFGKTTAQMSEAEKVALRYSFVQDQLSAASGDFARTSGSWANQVRIFTLQMDSLKATIGQGLINLFTPIIKVVNTVIGKLATLANAFKSFTELITGQKSSGASGQIADVASAAMGASSGMENAANSADNLSSANNGVAKSAQKAAEKMRSLMGFDQINKIDSQTDSSSDSGSSSSAGSGIGSAVDFGSLAQGNTVLDETDGKLSGLIKRVKELAALFKKGFKIGFGDSFKRIAEIQKHIGSIGKSLKEIFTDSGVVDAVNKYIDAAVLAFGKKVGAITSIGVTLATNLLGGVDKYLAKSKEFIKSNIISIFNVGAELQRLSGDYATALADIFSVFAGPEAQGITADIIGIFSDGFLGALSVATKFITDLAGMVVNPVIENVDKIKEAIANTLAPIKTILDTLHQAVVDTFTKISEVYDEYVSPFIQSVSDGISSIVSTFLDVYNTYIAPVLEEFAAKFTTVWQEHVQPALDGVIQLVGKVFEYLQALWESLIQPFIEWLVQNLMPVLGPIFETIGTTISNLVTIVSDTIKTITDIFGGFLDFCTGALTGDWEKCFSGLGKIVDGFKSLVQIPIRYVKENILQPFIDFIKGMFTKDWTESFGNLGNILNTFGENLSKIWKDIKKTFNGITDFVSGVFTGNWEKAWNGIKDIFSGVFEGLVDLAKAPINAIISAFNCVLDVVNGLIGKLNNISFKITVPNWVPGIGGSWWGFDGFHIPTIGTIPMLANGAYVKANTPQLAMIGDNRHQGELVSPEDKLQEMAVKAATLASGNENSAELLSVLKQVLGYLQSTPVVALDPESMRKYFIQKTNQNTKATGRSELLI